MYFLIRNNFCICVNDDLNELKKQYKDGDEIKSIGNEKRADEIFTIDEEGNLVKKQVM